MKSNRSKPVIIIITIIVGNAILTGLLALLIGNIFLDTSYMAQVEAWGKTGEYPFPEWLLLIIPRLRAWGIYPEIIFELSQAILWGTYAYIVKRFFRSVQDPVSLLWVPVIFNLFAYDFIQILLGTAAFYYMSRNQVKNNSRRLVES